MIGQKSALEDLREPAPPRNRVCPRASSAPRWALVLAVLTNASLVLRGSRLI